MQSILKFGIIFTLYNGMYFIPLCFIFLGRKQLPYCLNGSFDIVMYPFNYLAMQALFICVDNIISQEKPNTTIMLYIKTRGQSIISKLRLFKVENFINARILYVITSHKGGVAIPENYIFSFDRYCC